MPSGAEAQASAHALTPAQERADEGSTRPDLDVVVGATEEEPEYGAVARVGDLRGAELPLETAIAIEEIPGTFGDPFRILESLPGAAPMVSGVPYVYVRGAPPSGNGYYYDDIPLPQLFHLGVGPAVLHPSMLGELTFAPGVSSARYGRRLGAVVASSAPPAPLTDFGLLDVRLLDVNGAFAASLPGGGHAQGAARYGYPGVLTPVIGMDLNFSYWDYQFRARQPLGDRDALELVWLGSRDDLDNAQAVGVTIGTPTEQQDLALEFHRVELRLSRNTSALSTGVAVRFGQDLSRIGQEARARAESIAPRTWLRLRAADGSSVDMGIDGVFVSGGIRELPRGETFAPGVFSAVTRRTYGGYVDAQLPMGPSARLALGARMDAFTIGDTVDVTVDPRLRVLVGEPETLQFHAGIGTVHQPVAFAIPLPGFTDAALDRGVQRALQADAGLSFALPADFKAETNLFVHHYRDLLLPEAYLRALGSEASRANALSYGAEFFIRSPIGRRFSGFISYTLGFAEAREAVTDRIFSPEFDIRHVLNLVAQYELVDGLTLGGAVHLRSGKPANQFSDQGLPPAYALRMPGFVRLDARLAYRFRFEGVRLTAYTEVLNTTLAREVLDAECFFGSCRSVTEVPVWFPNLGLKAEF